MVQRLDFDFWVMHRMTFELLDLVDFWMLLV